MESARLFKTEAPVEKKYEQVWVPKTKLEKTTDYMHKRSNATNVLSLGNKAGLHLNQIKLGEREQALIVDDTYDLKILDQATKKVVHSIPIPSTQIRCSFVHESVFFLGLSFGVIQMYEAFPPYTKLGHVSLYDNVEPSTMISLSPGCLLVGLANGAIELFDITAESIKAQYPVAN